VDFSVRWAERAGGRYDESVLSAFLRGYLDGGGELDEGDSSVLTAAPAALVPWVLENLELAVEAPSEEQDLLAAALVAALLARPETARRREEVFSRCFARL
jgi:hypothetical protein